MSEEKVISLIMRDDIAALDVYRNQEEAKIGCTTL